MVWQPHFTFHYRARTHWARLRGSCGRSNLRLIKRKTKSIRRRLASGAKNVQNVRSLNRVAVTHLARYCFSVCDQFNSFNNTTFLQMLPHLPVSGISSSQTDLRRLVSLVVYWLDKHVKCLHSGHFVVWSNLGSVERFPLLSETDIHLFWRIA